MASKNKTKEVKSVLTKNNKIRKNMLRNSWSTQRMLPNILTESLGKWRRIAEEIYYPNKIFKNLYDYTHDNLSFYSQDINRKYLPKTDYRYDIFEKISNDSYSFETSSIIKNGKEEFIGGDRGYSKNNLNQNDYEENLKSSYEPFEEFLIRGDLFGSKTYTIYDEHDVKGRMPRGSIDNETIINDYYNAGIVGGDINLYQKTAVLFQDHKINTLIGRFHTSNDISNNETIEFIDTAKTKYGNSHGRNLLKKGRSISPNSSEDNIHGYENPYCRVWTYHHQYSKLKHMIRPFIDENGNVKNVEEYDLLKKVRSNSIKRGIDGGDYLNRYGVLNKENGLLNITPITDKILTKQCMFSIENLAWKDMLLDKELTPEQIGPNGGRIMWFPPYDLSFRENVQVDWNETKFIGRGEPIVTYSNTKRTGTLSFTLLIDHPSIINLQQNINNNDVGEDYEGDLLRFFAGCDLPSIMRSKQSLGNEDINNNSVNNEFTSPNDDIYPSVSFNVYFPNNYSGNDEKDNWWKRLKDYEMASNKGFTGINIEVSGTTESYKYPVDNDLIQKLRSINNYEHIPSSVNPLNSTKKNNIDSFLNILYTLDEDNFKEVNAKKEKNSNLNKFIDNKNNETYFKIEIKGIASSHDSKNANELAKRRADSIKNMLKKYDIDGEFVTSTAVEDVIEENINSEDAKKARRCEVKITFFNNYQEYEINKMKEDALTTDLIKIEIEEREKEREKKSKYGYYNEADYFRLLELNDNLLYTKIREKIKYFSPAYHSISPEGFNSRLTFLHQCTRQGNTFETQIARNIAFGHPPVCVLKIGDFINTKIVITGFDITYENQNGIQWDLNPEGIGVQPMYAKVTLNIILLGGQSLDAPVSRLNNAVSFNYYANTGVYDNRADWTTYEGNNIASKYTYMPEENNS